MTPSAPTPDLARAWTDLGAQWVQWWTQAAQRVAARRVPNTTHAAKVRSGDAPVRQDRNSGDLVTSCQNLWLPTSQVPYADCPVRAPGDDSPIGQMGQTSDARGVGG